MPCFFAMFIVSSIYGCEAMALAILLRNRLPQPLTRLFTPLPNHIRHHLTRLAAQGDPNPRGVSFFEHKRPQFVQYISYVETPEGCTLYHPHSKVSLHPA